MALVRLADIVFDAGTQIRAAINERVVAEYADCMTEGHVFPPVVLYHDGNRYYMADGFHRGLAAKRIGALDIDATVHPGTRSDALWFALQAFGEAKKQGLRPTIADTKHAVFLAFQEFPEVSAHRIAEQVGCSQQYVSKLREDYKVTTSCHLPDRAVGKDGKSYPATRTNVAITDSPQWQPVREMVEAGAQSRDIVSTLQVRPEFVAAVRRELGGTRDQSKASVQSRRVQMRDMAAEGYSSRQIAAAVGLSVEGCRDVLKKEAIDVPADRVTGRTRRHDPNRIIERIVNDAANLTIGVDLIVFEDVDFRQGPEWIAALLESRRALDQFIRRLTKEQQKHGQAA